MKLNVKRAIATLAGLTAAASIVPILVAPAASAAPTYSGPAAVTPASGDKTTDFTVQPEPGSTCPGDSANDGWRVTSYMIPASVDPATLVFDSEGPTPASFGQPHENFRQPLYDTHGSPYIQGQTANADNPGGPGFIINLPTFSLGVYGDQGSGFEIPPGEYNVGIACIVPAVGGSQIDRFWNNTMTVTAPTADTLAWAQGVIDEAPVLDSVTAGDGTLTATFSHDPSDPDNTTYTATATPVGGGAEVTETGSAPSILIDGLTNGTEYSVTVRAANNAGDSAESNALTGTPIPGAQPAVANLTATPDSTPDSGIVNLDWDAPASGETPTGYELTVDPAAGTVSVDDADTSAQVTGLTPGVLYEFTVTPLHDAPFVGTPASVEAAPVASGVTVLEQNVTVTRPAGALVFTQRCEDSATGDPLAGATWSDEPCAIAFGEATRVLDGANRGRYFHAAASLNNVQVDSWGDDTGWTVTGDMSEFVSGPDANQRFSGDQLGWAPAEVSKTEGLTVELGGPVAPGATEGMSNSPTLASSPAGSSLGIAELDAALELLIPVQKRAGLYTGTLTMTATPGA